MEHCRPQHMKKEESQSWMKIEQSQSHLKAEESQTQSQLSDILSPQERAEIIVAILSEVFHQFLLIVEKYIF